MRVRQGVLTVLVPVLLGAVGLARPAAAATPSYPTMEANYTTLANGWDHVERYLDTTTGFHPGGPDRLEQGTTTRAGGRCWPAGTAPSASTRPSRTGTPRTTAVRASTPTAAASRPIDAGSLIAPLQAAGVPASGQAYLLAVKLEQPAEFLAALLEHLG
ncbi:hypothetical protein [Kitasatospora acidiphila]|uniref:hypothetical protein n=1 Tax=Kitasatospora acidiphila TaxID=2567942 RepID=UPI003C76F9F0